MFGGAFWGVFGGALERFLRYVERFLEGEEQGNNEVLIILFNIIISVICLISLCGYVGSWGYAQFQCMFTMLLSPRSFQIVGHTAWPGGSEAAAKQSQALMNPKTPTNACCFLCRC